MIAIVVFSAVALAVYGPTLRHDFVALDDDLLVFANPIVQTLSPATILAAFTRYDPELYIPLTFLSFQIDWLLGDGAPWAFHAANILLHTGNALLVAAIGTLLTRRRSAGLLAGLLFLTHPINAEAVAWVSARKDLLSSFFALCCITAWLLWRRGWEHGRRWSIACFTLGLLSKIGAAAALPCIILIEWHERRRYDRDFARSIAPLLAVGVAFAAIAIGGKTTQVTLLTPAQLLLVGVQNIALTLRHFVLPLELSPFYRHAMPVAVAAALPSLGIVAALIVMAIAARKRVPMATLAIAWFITCLLPSMFNAAKAGDVFITSDRYAYLACGLPIIVMAFAAVRIGDLLMPFRGALRTAFAILLVTLGGLAQGQAALWRDSRTLYEHVLRLDPGIALAHNNLANADLAEGHIAAAEEAYRAAVALQPTNGTMRMNLATALEKQSLYAEAEVLLRAVIDDTPADRAEAWYRLGNLFAVQRREADAKTAYAMSLSIDPSFVLEAAALDAARQ